MARYFRDALGNVFFDSGIGLMPVGGQRPKCLSHAYAGPYAPGEPRPGCPSGYTEKCYTIGDPIGVPYKCCGCQKSPPSLPRVASQFLGTDSRYCAQDGLGDYGADFKQGKDVGVVCTTAAEGCYGCCYGQGKFAWELGENGNAVYQGCMYTCRTQAPVPSRPTRWGVPSAMPGTAAGVAPNAMLGTDGRYAYSPQRPMADARSPLGISVGTRVLNTGASTSASIANVAPGRTLASCGDSSKGWRQQSGAIKQGITSTGRKVTIEITLCCQYTSDGKLVQCVEGPAYQVG